MQSQHAPKGGTPRAWYSIRRVTAQAAAGAAAAVSAEIWIYADIGESWWAETVAAKDLVREIAALEVQRITVRLNSYGGSVPDGIAIYNALKRHAAHVTVCIDGIAASIASLVAMAGDTIEIADNALLMIHAPWAAIAGNAVELRQAADHLDKWAGAMATSYAAKTGKTAEEIAALWLNDGADHWFTAAEAVADGLADATTAALPVAASASRQAWARSDRPAPDPPMSPAASTANPPAAAAASTSETPMPQPNAAAPAPDQAAIDEARAAAVRAENSRQAEIRAAFAPHAALKGAGDLLEACLKDVDIDVVKAKAKILDLQAKGAEPVAGGYVATLEDQRDKIRGALRAALEIRAGLRVNEGSNPYRGHTLGEIARQCLAQAGVRDVPADKMGMIALAFMHSTSDFPLLLANVAQKAMMKGYEEADETFGSWTTPGSLPDFKIASSVDLGSFPALRIVPEGASYKNITIGERREQRVLATYGEKFMITRQAVINDDLDSFSRLPRKMGRAAIRTVGNLVYAVLTGNPNMADGVALFHANHGNLQAAGVLSTAALDQMRTAMARQKGIGQDTGALNIRLKTIIVPVSLEGAAKLVRDSEFEVGASAKNNTVPNTQRGTFDVVSDARLDDASTSIWYGAADPAMHDTVIVDYLDGNQAPTLEQQNGWNVDGVEFKVRMDASAKALDWKTLQRNG